MNKITLIFNGYWCDRAAGSLPNTSGVYCVYRGKDNGETVILNELLYVGESENVRDRIAGHERRTDWSAHLRSGETLIFSTAAVIGADRLQAEAAIINWHKPPTNLEYVRSFPFGDTEMLLTGRITLLTSSFVVRRSPSASSIFAASTAGRSW